MTADFFIGIVAGLWFYAIYDFITFAWVAFWTRVAETIEDIHYEMEVFKGGR